MALVSYSTRDRKSFKSSSDEDEWGNRGLQELGGRMRDEYQLGIEIGYALCWERFADLIGGRIFPKRPTEIEVKRWGPGGREHFADPRPGDYPGRASD